MEASEEAIQECVQKARAGDQEAIAELFRRFSDRIYRYLRLRVSDEATAEDLTQTVFVEMLSSLTRYKTLPEAKFSTWLFQIARFRLIDHYRKDRPTAPIDDVRESTHPNLSVMPDPPAGDLDWALQQLPEKYQTVLHFRFREDLDPEEVARILGTSTVNVRVLQHRALKALRKILDETP